MVSWIPEKDTKIQTLKNLNMKKKDSKTDKPCTTQNVIEPLILGNLTINPIDKYGDFEFEMEGHTSDAYKYVSTEEAKIIIDYLTKNINAL